MKNSIYVLLFWMTSVSLMSCELVGDIFQAGVWVGVLIVVGIIAMAIFLISKVSGKK